MTTAAPDVDDRAGLRTSVVVVSLVVVVHLVMAYFVSALTDDLFDLLIDLSGEQLALMIVIVLPAIPLAVAVLYWARDRILGSIACLVVVATGLLPYVRNTIDVRLIEAGKLDEMQTYIEWSNWMLVVALPVGAALGWGIARRRGSSWWPGVLVAGGFAALFYWLDLGPLGLGDSDFRPPAIALVYHVVPAVLGGLTCWWLEVRQSG